ncbi:hypothetical protein EA732_19000 [Acinetobacter baumannii]|nr:hypothetical protein EA732_19000 [Acinetobacter baumannii]
MASFNVSILFETPPKIDVYGMEKEAYLDSQRNWRKLAPDIEMNAELNRMVVNAVCNLAKNFKHYS